MSRFGLSLDLTGPVPTFNGIGIRAPITKSAAGVFLIEFDRNLDADEYIVGATATGVGAIPQLVEICVKKEMNGASFVTVVDDAPTDIQLDIDFAIIPKIGHNCCAMVDGGVTPSVLAIRGFNANIVRVAAGHVRLTLDVPLAPNEYAATATIREKWTLGARFVIVVSKGLAGGAAFVDVMTWSSGVPADLDFDVFVERYR